MSGIPFRCLTGDVDEMPWRETYIRNSRNLGGFAGMSLDLIDGWHNDLNDREYLTRLPYRRYYNELIGGVWGDLTEDELYVTREESHFSVSARAQGADIYWFPVGAEVNIHQEMVHSGTYNLTGAFKDIERGNKESREEYHVYVYQCSDGFFQGNARIAWGWKWTTSFKIPPTSTSGEVIGDQPKGETFTPIVRLDETFELQSDFPYTTLIIRHLAYPYGQSAPQSYSKFSGFTLKRVG